MSGDGNVDLGVSVDLFKLVEGTSLRLKNGKIGKVSENMNDGQWVEMEMDDGEVELVHGQEIDSVHAGTD